MIISIIMLAFAIILLAIFIYKIDAILDKLYNPFDEGYIKFYASVEKALTHQQKIQLEYTQILAKQIAEFNKYLKMRTEQEKQIAKELKNENTRNRNR